MSKLKGPRKEAGFSPGNEASTKQGVEMEDLGKSDVYDAAPGVERGGRDSERA